MKSKFNWVEKFYIHKNKYRGYLQKVTVNMRETYEQN